MGGKQREPRPCPHPTTRPHGDFQYFLWKGKKNQRAARPVGALHYSLPAMGFGQFTYIYNKQGRRTTPKKRMGWGVGCGGCCPTSNRRRRPQFPRAFPHKKKCPRTTPLLPRNCMLPRPRRPHTFLFHRAPPPFVEIAPTDGSTLPQGPLPRVGGLERATRHAHVNVGLRSLNPPVPKPRFPRAKWGVWGLQALVRLAAPVGHHKLGPALDKGSAPPGVDWGLVDPFLMNAAPSDYSALALGPLLSSFPRPG